MLPAHNMTHLCSTVGDSVVSLLTCLLVFLLNVITLYCLKQNPSKSTETLNNSQFVCLHKPSFLFNKSFLSLKDTQIHKCSSYCLLLSVVAIIRLKFMFSLFFIEVAGTFMSLSIVICIPNI